MRSGAGLPGRGQTTSPRSRRVRHVAHGHPCRSVTRPKRATYPSRNVIVTPSARSTWVSDGWNRSSTHIACPAASAVAMLSTVSTRALGMPSRPGPPRSQAMMTGGAVVATSQTLGRSSPHPDCRAAPSKNDVDEPAALIIPYRRLGADRELRQAARDRGDVKQMVRALVHRLTDQPARRPLLTGQPSRDSVPLLVRDPRRLVDESRTLSASSATIGPRSRSFYRNRALVDH
jgi:hypothetical protein